MSTLVYRTTELRDLTARRCWFSIVAGWRDGIQVRRVTTEIPGLEGRTDEGAVEDIRVIRLHGLIVATSEANWDTVSATLNTTFDPAAATADLVVHSPYLGLSAGTRTISAIVESVRVIEIVPSLVTEYDVVLHALGSPPNWSTAP